jgi:BRCA1-associated protein
MICGYLGCGRYENGHSLSHYIETCHNFSISSVDKLIWSYLADVFVHRIFDRTTIAEIPDRKEFESHQFYNQQNLLNANISSMMCEQLEMQRKHFEKRLEQRKSELEKEILLNSDAVIQDLSLRKEALLREIQERKAQITNAKKQKVHTEQLLADVPRQLEEVGPH